MNASLIHEMTSKVSLQKKKKKSDKWKDKRKEMEMSKREIGS